MGRNTITDVRDTVELMNSRHDDVTFSFNCWGTGRNKYQLIDDDTGEQYGPSCLGATEFLKMLRGFEAGWRL